MQRHIAKVKNTDRRCVVVFMQIPGDSEFALILPTENLTPRLEQVIQTILETPEGQSNPDLADVLGRRMYSDSGKTVLQYVHENGLLERVSIDQIVMLPAPNTPYDLRIILEQMGKLEKGEKTVERYNQHMTNFGAQKSEDRQAVAMNLLTQAKMLREEAARKEFEAFSYAPELKVDAKVEEVLEDIDTFA